MGQFAELNLRTYVRCGGQPGIAFLSILADSRVGAALAGWLTPLPYRYAAMPTASLVPEQRWEAPGLLSVEYRPLGPLASVASDGLDEWLLERYAAFVAGPRCRLLRLSVEHPRWTVQSVKLLGERAELGRMLGLG